MARTTNLLTPLVAITFILIIASCGKEEENIFGEYQLSKWELSSCRLVDNDQIGTLIDQEVCFTWADDNSQSCTSIIINLLQDSTFLYDFKTIDYDSRGNQTDSSNTSESGTYTVKEDELTLKFDVNAVRTYTFDLFGRFTRTTMSVNICDTKEFFSKIK